MWKLSSLLEFDVVLLSRAVILMFEILYVTFHAFEIHVGLDLRVFEKFRLRQGIFQCFMLDQDYLTRCWLKSIVKQGLSCSQHVMNLIIGLTASHGTGWRSSTHHHFDSKLFFFSNASSVTQKRCREIEYIELPASVPRLQRLAGRSRRWRLHQGTDDHRCSRYTSDWQTRGTRDWESSQIAAEIRYLLFGAVYALNTVEWCHGDAAERHWIWIVLDSL